MLRPLVLQQILDTIVTPQASSSSSSPSANSGSNTAVPHTALLVLKETGTLYAASSRYVSPSSPSSSSGSTSPGESSAREAPPHPVFRGLLCSSSSSSSSSTGGGGADCSSLEECNRAIGVLSCLAWRERCARRSVEDEERAGCLSVRSSQYGLLHIRPLLPPPRSQRQQRSLSSHSYTQSQSPSPNRPLGADTGSIGPSPGPSPSSFAAADHGAEGEGEEAVFLLVLNAALPEAGASASPQEEPHGAAGTGEGSTKEQTVGAGGAAGETTSSTSLPALQARLQGLAQLVATSLAPGLRILER